MTLQIYLTGVTVTIVSSDYMVNESQSSVEVCTSLTDIPDGGLECDVIATINTTDGPKASKEVIVHYDKHAIEKNVIGMKMPISAFKAS